MAMHGEAATPSASTNSAAAFVPGGLRLVAPSSPGVRPPPCGHRTRPAPADGAQALRHLTAAGALGAALAAASLARSRPRRRRGGATVRCAVPVADLLPPGVADEWPELACPLEGFEAVVGDLGDLDRCYELVAEVFGVKEEESDSVTRGIADRMGARRSVLGPDAAAPRPFLRRPAPVGSADKPDQGLVLAYAPVGDAEGRLAALVDLSLWPNDGRVRAPEAETKPGVAAWPYMLNLCVDPKFRRQGVARALLELSERLVRDVWGDEGIYLHVEDSKLPANALYEATGYMPLRYVYDKKFPYTKAEAKVLRSVTWRRKKLGMPTPGAPWSTPELLVEEKPEVPPPEEVEPEPEEEEEEEQDYSWVEGLIKN